MMCKRCAYQVIDGVRRKRWRWLRMRRAWGRWRHSIGGDGREIGKVWVWE